MRQVEEKQINGRNENQYDAFNDGWKSQKDGHAQESEYAGQDDVMRQRAAAMISDGSDGAAGRNVARNHRGARIFRSASELESKSINQLEITACHQRTGLDKNEKINDKDVRH
jgi:hypothetical protein